jgi:hypothetical protein
MDDTSLEKYFSLSLNSKALPDVVFLVGGLFLVWFGFFQHFGYITPLFSGHQS